MIRIGLNHPVMPRLRVNWHSTQTQFSRHARSARDNVRQLVYNLREWQQHVCGSLTARFSLRARAIARQRARLIIFEDKYEDLVDLLCWAAKEEGANAKREARYAELRTWMRSNYGKLRPRLLTHLPPQVRSEGCDPFEALFASADITEVTNAATGIDNLMQTRMALDAYRDTLEAPSLKT